jgi:hypothetical protein
MKMHERRGAERNTPAIFVARNFATLFPYKPISAMFIRLVVGNVQDVDPANEKTKN